MRLSKAVNLEKSEKYPRIILSEEIISKLNNYSLKLSHLHKIINTLVLDKSKKPIVFINQFYPLGQIENPFLNINFISSLLD